MTVETAGRRVEEVLDRLSAAGNTAALTAAEDLVRILMDFYGEGLGRIVALLSRAGGDPLAGMLDDEVLTALLVLHELHPEDTLTRVRRGLRVAGAVSARVEHFEEPTGTLRLVMPAGDGCGCPATTGAVRQRVEAALSCFAPEVACVVLESAARPPREPVLLQIGGRPEGAA